MASANATRASATRPIAGSSSAGTKKVAWGSLEIAANPAAADFYGMCRIPSGAVVTGGRLYGGPLNTAGNVSAIDADIGFASDADAFGNLGAWSQTAVLGVKPETGYSYPFGGLLMTAGPQAMTREQLVGITVVTSTASASFTTGTLSMVVEYEMPA